MRIFADKQLKESLEIYSNSTAEIDEKQRVSRKKQSDAWMFEEDLKSHRRMYPKY